MRSKLEAVSKQLGRPVKELENLIQLPVSMQQVWLYFMELHNSRSSNGFGVNPISYSDIKSYFELHDIVPSEWEIKLIKQLDIVVLNIISAQNTKAAESKPKQTKK